MAAPDPVVGAEDLTGTGVGASSVGGDTPAHGEVVEEGVRLVGEFSTCGRTAPSSPRVALGGVSELWADQH